jgi:hypothetical protein
MWDLIIFRLLMLGLGIATGMSGAVFLSASQEVSIDQRAYLVGMSIIGLICAGVFLWADSALKEQYSVGKPKDRYKVGKVWVSVLSPNVLSLVMGRWVWSNRPHLEKVLAELNKTYKIQSIMKTAEGRYLVVVDKKIMSQGGI